jgi:hypothetical protein
LQKTQTLIWVPQRHRRGKMGVVGSKPQAIRASSASTVSKLTINQLTDSLIFILPSPKQFLVLSV